MGPEGGLGEQEDDTKAPTGNGATYCHCITAKLMVCLGRFPSLTLTEERLKDEQTGILA